jgi:hypothetical protein
MLGISAANLNLKLLKIDEKSNTSLLARSFMQPEPFSDKQDSELGFSTSRWHG